VGTYIKYPYRTEFPDSSESGRNSQTLEDALQWARGGAALHLAGDQRVRHGGGPVHPDAETAIVTNALSQLHTNHVGAVADSYTTLQPSPWFTAP
jgi:hypothetical protein